MTEITWIRVAAGYHIADYEGIQLTIVHLARNGWWKLTISNADDWETCLPTLKGLKAYAAGLITGRNQAFVWDGHVNRDRWADALAAAKAAR